MVTSRDEALEHLNTAHERMLLDFTSQNVKTICCCYLWIAEWLDKAGGYNGYGFVQTLGMGPKNGIGVSDVQPKLFFGVGDLVITPI